jgi:hypothetical protein
LIVAGARVALCRAGRTSFLTCCGCRLDRLLIILVSIYWVGLYGWYWWFFLPRTYGAT